MEGRKLGLNDLPEPILLHILSKLRNGKEVVRSCLLYTQWRNLWKSVPVAIRFCFPNGCNKKIFSHFVASANKDLHQFRVFEKIAIFKVCIPVFYTIFVKDVDLWIRFATQVGDVKKFHLECGDYELPQFAFKNTPLKSLILGRCKMNPSGSVSWTSLISLSIESMDLSDVVMEKVLCGCPNLECLKIIDCVGFHQLEISSLKLRKLFVQDNDDTVLMELYAPNLLNMELYGVFRGIHLKNVTSLVTAVLQLSFHFQDGEDMLEEEELSKLKGLLHCVAQAKNLELGPWCINCLSTLELKGWQFPPSSRKVLKLHIALEQLELPGILRFLQSSSALETLDIDWPIDEPRKQLSRYRNEDEESRKFEMHNFNCSLLHLKTIKIINFNGSSSISKCVLSLAKYLLKNAMVLEKFIIVARFKGRGVSRDYVKMAEEFLSFPRSSPHASVVLSNK